MSKLPVAIIVLLLLSCRTASALDWNISISTDPSDGRNIQVVSTSTDSFRFNIKGATTKCEVTPVVTVPVQSVYTLSGRYLTCEFLDGSMVANFTGCLNEQDHQSLTVLFLRNLNKLYQLSVECINVEEKERYPNEPEDKIHRRIK